MNQSNYPSIRFVENDWRRLLMMNDSNYPQDYPWDLLKMNDCIIMRWMMNVNWSFHKITITLIMIINNTLWIIQRHMNNTNMRIIITHNQIHSYVITNCAIVFPVFTQRSQYIVIR
jgi:hypothetical protein